MAVKLKFLDVPPEESVFGNNAWQEGGFTVSDPFQVTCPFNGCDHNIKTEVHKGLTTKFASSTNITSEPRKVVS